MKRDKLGRFLKTKTQDDRRKIAHTHSGQTKQVKAMLKRLEANGTI